MQVFFVMLSGMIVISCDHIVVDENEPIDPRINGPESGKYKVHLAVRVPRNSIFTYANEAGSVDENHIDTLFVKIFADNVYMETRKFWDNDLQPQVGTNDSIVDVAFETDVLMGSTIASVEVFANRIDVEPITDEIPLPDSGTASTCFLMSGKGALSYDGDVYRDTIHLVRNVAKLRILLDKSTNCIPANLIILYEQTTVEVLQVPDRTLLFEPSPPPPPIVPPTGLAYINYSPRTGNDLRPETKPWTSFNGGQIDSLYLNENYLNNSDYNASNITQVKITVRTQEPNMPINSAEYTFPIFTEGSYQIKRNHIYTLDLKIAGQSTTPFVTLGMTPWNDEDVSGDIYGSTLNLDRSTVKLMPVHTQSNPAIVNYETDNTSIRLDWSRVNPAHNIDTTTMFLYGRNGEIRFSWVGDGAPDYSFRDTLYVITGNIEKVVVLEYDISGGNFGPWVGTFHRWDQTGERIIKIRNTGEWQATVTQGASFIRLNGAGTTDANWGTSLAALGNDLGFDADYPVAGSAVSLSGHGIIYFRVGITDSLAYWGAAPRYGVIEITTDNGVRKIYVRQGEEADYVMRESDPNPAINEPNRPYAARFAPFNLADPLRGTGGNNISMHNYMALVGVMDSLKFTDYPTQAGYFFQWNLGAGSDLKAYNPVNALLSISGWQTSAKPSWIRRLEPCPVDYRHPNDSLQNPATSEIRQSWYATPNILNNSVWGFYADGFFDRLTVGQSPNGVDSTAVSYNPSNLADPLNAEIAYAGRLVYNPSNNASLFLPAPGIRAEVIGSGALTHAGDIGAYWTSSMNSVNGWAFYFTPTSFYSFGAAHQSTGISIRCVKYGWGLPGSIN